MKKKITVGEVTGPLSFNLPPEILFITQNYWVTFIYKDTSWMYHFQPKGEETTKEVSGLPLEQHERRHIGETSLPRVLDGLLTKSEEIFTGCPTLQSGPDLKQLQYLSVTPSVAEVTLFTNSGGKSRGTTGDEDNDTLSLIHI